ncbi:guanylate kinase [Skermanella sp. TT6]|uniref:Guanylate kinase n=2 Tax=Skermanella cutis TaxID=2775420 RepID=A0ABX7B179_9PROT|nr:guanylate kinase [Skermanella sp. TT6]QQP88028.1 guanylate kinase [Skermanella sp. TT6]
MTVPMDMQPAGPGPAKIGRRGLMLVLSSPSGAGKTTIARRMLQRNSSLTMSVSVTTRPMRPGEVDGVDYHFIDRERFEQMVAERQLLEHARVFGNYYGTPKEPVEQALAKGREILFDIDWQGTQQLAENARDDLVSVFVLPPSAKELERRLYARAQDSAEVIAGRMAKASDEMSHYFDYDYVIVNHDIESSVQQVQTILEAERLKRRRQVGLADFVRQLQDGL